MRQRIAGFLLFLGVLLFSFLTSTHHTSSPSAFNLAISPTPGLQIFGSVRLEDQQGVPGVAIYRAFASYDGEVVATTDANGFYRSDFTWIPGDEMTTVYARRAGYVFTPEYYYWRHYYGREIRQLDFTAARASLVYLPWIANSSLGH